MDPVSRRTELASEPPPETGSGGPPWVRRVPWLRLAAELGAVFLGVTLGLLADDWRESRIDREEEAKALSALLSDLVSDSMDLDNLRVNMEISDSSAMWLRQRLGQPGVRVDSAAQRIIAIFNHVAYQGPQATYAGLRSSSRLVLVRDDELRRAITNYYEERQPNLRDFYEAYDEFWYPFRKAASIDWELTYPPDRESYGLEGVLGFRLTTSWDRFPTDPQLRYYLDELGILSSVIADRIGVVLKKNGELRASIRDHLRE